MNNNFNSTFLNIINSCFAAIQSKTDILRDKSYILRNLDFVALVFLLMTFIVSSFATTEQIGAVSILVPIVVLLKMLITKGDKVELERWNFYLFVWLFICFISNFTSSLPDKSFYGFMKTFVYITFYFAVCKLLKNNKKFIIPILIVIAIILSGESIIGIIQNSMRTENISTWQDTSYLNPEDVLTRIYGTLKPYNPNLTAGFLTAGFMSIPALSVLCFKSKKYKTAILCSIFLALCAFTIFLTGCRGTYISVLAIIISIGVASFHMTFKSDSSDKQKKAWKVSALLFALFSGLFLLLNHGILKRIMSIFIMRGDSSTSFRLNVYHSSVQMLHDNLIFGIGVGNKVFREIYGLYMLSGYDALSSYCIFLEMAVESGIFALIAYLMFLFSILNAGLKKFIAINDFGRKIIILTGVISVIAVTVHGFTDTIYFRPQVQYIFWTMAAIITASVNDEDTIENENT